MKLELILAAVGLFVAGLASGETGVSSNKIILGMSNATSGPASALGIGVKKGAMVYFDKINKVGGVHGRKIVIKSYDDGYEPVRTKENTLKLMNTDKVFAFFGFVGTPTSKAAVPLAVKNKIPYIAPFTGAEFLRKAPANNVVVNIRASYFNETEALVEHFVSKGLKKIGIFIQDDGYGAAGKNGVIKALRKRKMRIVGEGRYIRNDESTVAAGVQSLESFAPEAIIMVGAYKQCGLAVRKIKNNPKLKNAQIANISFVGTVNLIKEMGAAGEGTLISQVMPSPEFSNIPIVQEYRQDIAIAGGRIGYTSLEGYVDAAITIEALKKVGKSLGRSSFISSFEQLNGEFKGLDLKFIKKKNQGMNKVYITQVKDGKAREIKDIDAI